MRGCKITQLIIRPWLLATNPQQLQDVHTRDAICLPSQVCSRFFCPMTLHTLTHTYKHKHTCSRRPLWWLQQPALKRINKTPHIVD